MQRNRLRAPGWGSIVFLMTWSFSPSLDWQTWLMTFLNWKRKEKKRKEGREQRTEWESSFRRAMLYTNSSLIHKQGSSNGCLDTESVLSGSNPTHNDVAHDLMKQPKRPTCSEKGNDFSYMDISYRVLNITFPITKQTKATWTNRSRVTHRARSLRLPVIIIIHASLLMYALNT